MNKRRKNDKRCKLHNKGITNNQNIKECLASTASTNIYMYKMKSSIRKYKAFHEARMGERRINTFSDTKSNYENNDEYRPLDK